MSRPVSPFVFVDACDDSGPQIRLDYADPPVAPASTARSNRALVDIEERILALRQQRLAVVELRNDVQARFRLITADNGDDLLPPNFPTGATAPPGGPESDDDDNNGGLDPTTLPAHDESLDTSGETDVQRASAMSFLADESIASLTRRLQLSSSRNALPTDADLDNFLQAEPNVRATLELQAADAHPDYNADMDPKMEELRCAICYEIITDPAVLLGHMYDRTCIVNAVSATKKCPMTNTPVTLEQILPNFVMKNHIAAVLQESEKDVCDKRKALVRLLATKILLERNTTTGTAATSSFAVELDQRLKHMKDVQRQWNEAARKRRDDLRRRYAAQIEQLHTENRRLQSMSSQRDRDLESVRIEREHERESIRSYFKTAIRSLQQEDAQLQEKMRSIQEEEDHLIQERDVLRAAHAEEAHLSQAQMFVRRVVQPGGSRCTRCGLRRSDQTLSSMHRCFRCSRTHCHDCCNNVGAVVLDPQKDDVSDVDDTVTSNGAAEHVILGGRGLQVVGWRRICSSCYTTCLRARLELESNPLPLPHSQSAASLFPAHFSELTEDGLTLLYVLTPSERKSWRYLTAPSELPDGLMEEWKRAPSRAAVLFDEGVRSAQNELIPAIMEQTRAVVARVQRMLKDIPMLGIQE